MTVRGSRRCRGPFFLFEADKSRYSHVFVQEITACQDLGADT
jgi:hypothetical protein